MADKQVVIPAMLSEYSYQLQKGDCFPFKVMMQWQRNQTDQINHNSFSLSGLPDSGKPKIASISLVRKTSQETTHAMSILI